MGLTSPLGTEVLSLADSQTAPNSNLIQDFGTKNTYTYTSPTKLVEDTAYTVSIVAYDDLNQPS